ncbi:hypothetical protein Tco_0689243 [Tanacetum coccineum]
MRSCGTRVLCGAAEPIFLARLVLLAERWNLCSPPGLGFSSGPGLTVRCMVWAYGLDDTIRMRIVEYCSSPSFLAVRCKMWTRVFILVRSPSVDIIQIVNHTIVDEVKEHAGKKKKKVVFEELPAKRLRSDAASASEAVPTTGSKGSAALKRLELQIEPGSVGSSYVPPPVEEFVSSSVTPTPEPDADEGYGSSQDEGALGNNAEASTFVPDVVSPTDDFYDSQTVDTATTDNIYVPEWGVTNGARVDNRALFRNLLNHITPGYWAMLCNLSPATFLDGFNINSAQHTCMISELRLRYEHEIMAREKFMKKFTNTCAVVQQRDAEIAALRTRLEKSEREAAEVVSLCGSISELEVGVAVKSQEVDTFGTKNAELSSKVSALESKRGELKRHDIKLDDKARRFEQKSAELDARIADVRRDMDNDLYPHMFTVIVGRRWLLSHGVHLAMMKCAQSAECQSALGKVITLAVNNGIQEGLEARIEHGRSGRTLAQVEAYDPGVKDDFVSASGSVSGKVLMSEVIPTVRAVTERRELCPPSLAGTSGSVPLPGSSLGVADYQVLFDDGGSATQPPIVQAHDDLFDTSVLNGVGA